MGVVQRSRRVEILRTLNLVLRRLHVPTELRVEVLELEARSRQRGRELLPETCGRIADGADLGHVVGVALALAVGRAALDPDREQYDDQDRERDEPDETEKRGQVARGAEARAARASVSRWTRPSLGWILPRRRLLLAEEVEVEDVFVASRHRPISPGATLDEV